MQLVARGGKLNAVAIALQQHSPRFQTFFRDQHQCTVPIILALMFTPNVLQRNVTTHSLPHHNHSHRIEVIKLVIVFFSLVWLSSVWDIFFLKTRAFSFYSFHASDGVEKHQRTLSRLDLLILIFRAIHRFNKFQNVATQKNFLFAEALGSFLITVCFNCKFAAQFYFWTFFIARCKKKAGFDLDGKFHWRNILQFFGKMQYWSIACAWVVIGQRDCYWGAKWKK